MKKGIITVPNALKLPLSPAIKAGDYVFVSGQIGFMDSGGKAVKGIGAQTRQCLENIKQVLGTAGSSLNDVVKVTVFLAKIDHFAQMNEVYQSYFPKDYPARSTIVVGEMIPGMLVEIECIAYSP
jgi:2-iminobutanoate/2-iminopropanoate deaminase